MPVALLYRPVDSHKLIVALEGNGHQRVKGGKGSHVKLKAAGRPTNDVPEERGDLSPVVLKSVAGALGFRNIGDMLTYLN